MRPVDDVSELMKHRIDYILRGQELISITGVPKAQTDFHALVDI